MKLFNLIRTILIIGISGFFMVSCSNELDSISPSQRAIPVVYSVIEIQRDTLTVRVTKTFSGLGSALDYARIEDSVYFPQARVWLEKWNGDILICRAELFKYNLNSRLPGVFAATPNWNYILVKSAINEPLFSGTVLNQEYHLTVEIPGNPLIFAKTMAFPAGRLLSPRLTFQQNLFLDPLDFSWKTEAPYSELYFRLNYYDIYADTIISRSVNWREFHSTAANDVTKESVFGQAMMKRIAGQVPADRKVTYRKITSFQVVVVGIPADLYDYRLMNQILPSDQIGFPVTNVVNGIGLFTSQTLTSFDIQLDLRSRDSIASGQFTRQFNFRFN